jgi:hypothetical protein
MKLNIIDRHYEFRKESIAVHDIGQYLPKQNRFLCKNQT